jgi:preprotein translocase subunit SecG
LCVFRAPLSGGLSSTIGGSQMLGGVQKTTDFLDKSTWTLATILIALILLSSLSFTGTLSDTDSKIIDNTETAAPVAPLHQYKSTSYRIRHNNNYKNASLSKLAFL